MSPFRRLTAWNENRPFRQPGASAPRVDAGGGAVFLAFYWRCLDIWFYQDDFGWLHLWPVRDLKEFIHSLLFARAHGSIRVFSTNTYFMLFSAIFGFNPLPFHLAVFGTVITILFLIASVTRELGGSPWTGFWTQVLWLANSCVAVSFCWISIFNQTLSVCLLLAAFWCLLRYAATGDERWFRWQWLAYLAGFGALEVNAVYPALASLYAWLYEKRLLRRLWPMFGVSALFALAQLSLAVREAQGPYALHTGGHIFVSLGKYSELALGATRFAHFFRVPAWLPPALTLLLAAGAAWAVGRAGKLGVLAAGWFLLLLAPYLPLRDHRMDYYLTGPALALAAAGGFALGARSRKWAALPVALYLGMNLPAAWQTVSWHYARSQRAREVVEAVVEIHRQRPGQTILLTGVDTDTFLGAIADLPFELYGIRNVYLAPGTDASIRDGGRLAPKYVLPLRQALDQIGAGRGAVYDISGPVVRNVTRHHVALWQAMTRGNLPAP